MAPLTTKREVLKLFVREELAAQSALVQAVSTTEQAAKAEAVLKDVLGKRRRLGERALGQALQRGVLPAPRAPWGVALTGGGRWPKNQAPATLLAGPLPKALRDEIGDVVGGITKGGRFGALLDSLGRPTVDEWAALLQRPATLAFKEGEKFGGQVATVSGWLLERIRKSSHAFRVRAPDKAAEIIRAYNAHQKLDGTAAFKGPFWVEHILDGQKQALSDGMRLARSGDGRVLVVMIEEVKLESVAGDVRAQFDDVIERIRGRGIILDGGPVPPERIDLPVARSRPAWSTELVAYLENAKPRPILTPAGYQLAVVGVDSRELRDFVEVFLAAWRKRKAAGVRP